MDDGCASPVVNLRGDLWGHIRGPGSLSLGSRMLMTLGTGYREAIRGYYRGLLDAGVIRSKEETNSARKTSVALTPEFNTWGAQVARNLDPQQFNERVLVDIYEEFKASGMRAGMFVVDDKWEGKYGTLRHSQEAFPNFEDVLRRVRDDGHLLGLWAALLRCEDPAELGLTHAHMLKGVDGEPLRLGNPGSGYYIFDFTQPTVQEVLREVAQGFVRRYRPDLVKFDFGYELPLTQVAAPEDMEWAGERLLKKGLEVIIGAMKEETPDLVVMYYGLSPLLLDYYDLHSVDDLFLCMGEYDLEANRRIFFSSLCGELGVPTYGSSGYDWPTAREIWFDSAVVGTLGSLHSFTGDEIASSPEPELIAKYNGLSKLLRRSCAFTVEPLDANIIGARCGGTSSSWARLEDGQVVLLALRTHGLRGGGVGACNEVAKITASVVLASRDGEPLAKSPNLGVVPFGAGELVLRRQAPGDTHAEVTEHYLQGGAETSRVNIDNGFLRIPLRERLRDGRCVEWVEVNVHS